MCATSDMDLLRQYAHRQSESAFAELVGRHINLVFSVALRHVANVEDAEDVTQAVFILLARKAAALGPGTAVIGWLYKTTRFTAARAVRARARRHAREQEGSMQSGLSEADNGSVWRQLAPLLDEAMARLTEKERAVLGLRYFENRSAVETAALLGIGQWAAHKRTERAVEKLRAFFARRGVGVSAASLIGAVSAHSVQAAPAMLAKSVTVVALVKGAGAGGSTLALVKGALKVMAWTKAKTAIVAGVALLIAAGTTTVLVEKLGQAREPSYQGKSINAWLSQLNSAFNQNDLQKRHEAEQAFQTIGTQAVPYIVANLRRRDSALAGRYRNIFGKLPAGLQRLLPSPWQEFPSYIGQFALFAIGEPAKPSLIKILKDGDPVVREASAATLGSLAHYDGMDLHDAEPALIELLLDPDAGVRWHAASDLGYLGPDAATAVPRLIPLLKDPQTGRKGAQVYVRSAAACTLGKIGPLAETALPALRVALEDPSPYDRAVAAIAIWRFDPRAPTTLPVLIEALSLASSGEQSELSEGLEEMVATMGPGDKEAFPVLLKAVVEPRSSGLLLRPMTLQKITNALIRIDPEAAARTGVKRTATNESAPPS